MSANRVNGNNGGVAAPIQPRNDTKNAAPEVGPRSNALGLTSATAKSGDAQMQAANLRRRVEASWLNRESALPANSVASGSANAFSRTAAVVLNQIQEPPKDETDLEAPVAFDFNKDFGDKPIGQITQQDLFRVMFERLADRAGLQGETRTKFIEKSAGWTLEGYPSEQPQKFTDEFVLKLKDGKTAIQTHPNMIEQLGEIQAVDLIGKYTSAAATDEDSGVIFGRRSALDEQGLGEELATLAKTNPLVVQKTLEHLKANSADYAGQDITQTMKAMFGKMSNEDLTRMSETASGRALLTKVFESMEAQEDFNDAAWSPQSREDRKANKIIELKIENAAPVVVKAITEARAKCETKVFAVSNIDSLEEQARNETHKGFSEPEGGFQCARLPLAWEDSQETPLLNRSARRERLTRKWIMGDQAVYGINLPKGTVLATFRPDTGRYAGTDSSEHGENHTVIFLGWKTDENGVKGMEVVEQRGGPPKIKFIPFDKSKVYHSNAGRFYVVQLKKN